MNRMIRVPIAVLSLSAYLPVSAYELATHARITYTAYAQSALKQDAALLENLGILNPLESLASTTMT